MDLRTLFNSMEESFLLKPFPSLAERRNQLFLLKSLLQTHAEALVEAVDQDFSHRARYETLLLEIFPAILTINYCLKNIKRWMKRRPRRVSFLFKPASAYLLPQPLGVVGIIVPWNYPIFLSMGPLAYALAAGNKVLIKFSELTPRTGALLSQLIHNSELKHSVQGVNGDLDTSKKFTKLAFKHLLFTGSSKVGKLVMKAASQHLTPVTLELGGKSPAILSKTIRLRDCERLFMGKIINAGQTCVAPDYLFIPEDWEVKIETLLKKFVHKRYPELLHNEDYSALISLENKKRLTSLLEDALKKGARIVPIGQTESTRVQHMPIFLLFNVHKQMKVMQEEIFGPILPIISYSSIQEVIEKIRSLPNPLVLYYFGNDKKEIDLLQYATLSGALVMNDSLTHLAIDDLPFGGVGLSGMGQYHGQEGFDSFSKLKSVFIQKRFTMVSWFYPPHAKLIQYLLRWVGGIKLRREK